MTPYRCYKEPPRQEQRLQFIRMGTVSYTHLTRKLLLNQRELDSLYGRMNRDGYTVVALSLYWKNAWCKVKIGVAKGKKQHDKRSDVKEREWQLDKARIMKNAGR